MYKNTYIHWWFYTVLMIIKLRRMSLYCISKVHQNGGYNIPRGPIAESDSFAYMKIWDFGWFDFFLLYTTKSVLIREDRLNPLLNHGEHVWVVDQFKDLLIEHLMWTGDEKIDLVRSATYPEIGISSCNCNRSIHNMI